MTTHCLAAIVPKESTSTVNVLFVTHNDLSFSFYFSRLFITCLRKCACCSLSHCLAAIVPKESTSTVNGLFVTHNDLSFSFYFSRLFITCLRKCAFCSLSICQICDVSHRICIYTTKCNSKIIICGIYEL